MFSNQKPWFNRSVCEHGSKEMECSLILTVNLLRDRNPTLTFIHNDLN